MFANLNPGAISIRADFDTTLDLAQRFGWAGCDLPVAEALRLAGESSADEVAARFAAAGIRPGGWGLPLDWRKPYAREQLGVLDRQAALAERLGCTRTYTWLLPSSDERPWRENFAWNVQQLGPVARVLAERGCRLGLEFVGPRTMREGKRYGFIHSPEAMLCLAEAIGPSTGLLVDSYHWYTALGTTADLRSLRAEDVVYVHVNDAPEGIPVEQQLDQVRKLPGASGVIDIAGFLQALREVGYDGPVTPEPFEKQLAAMNPDEACRVAREHMQKIWGTAGLE